MHSSPPREPSSTSTAPTLGLNNGAASFSARCSPHGWSSSLRESTPTICLSNSGPRTENFDMFLFLFTWMPTKQTQTRVCWGPKKDQRLKFHRWWASELLPRLSGIKVMRRTLASPASEQSPRVNFEHLPYIIKSSTIIIHYYQTKQYSFFFFMKTNCWSGHF